MPCAEQEEAERFERGVMVTEDPLILRLLALSIERPLTQKPTIEDLLSAGVVESFRELGDVAQATKLALSTRGQIRLSPEILNSMMLLCESKCRLR